MSDFPPYELLPSPIPAYLSISVPTPTLFCVNVCVAIVSLFEMIS